MGAKNNMFSQELRDQADIWWQKSFNHPFIQQLTDGSLPMDCFRYYLIQDRYYLEHFSQIHRWVGERSQNPVLKELMVFVADNLEAGEQAIRDVFFDELAITPQEIATTATAPTAYHYVSHMYRQLAEHTPEAAFAGLVPCSWLYHEIGLRLMQKSSPVPIYQQWIDTYTTDEMVEVVAKQRALLDQLGDTLSAVELEPLRQAFLISSIEEYNFWQMAMDFQTW